MILYIVKLKQEFADGTVHDGYLGQDGTLVRTSEEVRHFETISDAAVHLSPCDYDGCKLLAATIERVDLGEAPPCIHGTPYGIFCEDCYH